MRPSDHQDELRLLVTVNEKLRVIQEGVQSLDSRMGKIEQTISGSGSDHGLMTRIALLEAKNEEREASDKQLRGWVAGAVLSGCGSLFWMIFKAALASGALKP